MVEQQPRSPPIMVEEKENPPSARMTTQHVGLIIDGDRPGRQSCDALKGGWRCTIARRFEAQASVRPRLFMQLGGRLHMLKKDSDGQRRFFVVNRSSANDTPTC